MNQADESPAEMYTFSVAKPHAAGASGISSKGAVETSLAEKSSASSAAPLWRVLLELLLLRHLSPLHLMPARCHSPCWKMSPTPQVPLLESTASSKGDLERGASSSSKSSSSSSHLKRKSSKTKNSSTSRSRVHTEPDVSSSPFIRKGKFDELVDVIERLEAQVFAVSVQFVDL